MHNKILSKWNLNKSFNKFQLWCNPWNHMYLFDKLLEPPTNCHFLAGIKQVLLTYCWLILRPKSRTHSYTCFTTLPPILLTLPPYLHVNVRHIHVRTLIQALFGYHCAQIATTKIECWANSCTSNWYIYLPYPVWAIWFGETEGNNLFALHFIELSRGNLIKAPRWQCCGQSNRLVINQSSSAEGRLKSAGRGRGPTTAASVSNMWQREKIEPKKKWAQRGNLKLRSRSDRLINTHYIDNHREGGRNK